MSVPGFNINKVPKNPIATLAHLLIPTASFKNITENIITMNGPVWKIVIVETRVRYLNPENINIVAPNNKLDLNR